MLKEECIICKSPLVYSDKEEIMECFICHKKEGSKTKCENGHYVCDQCHLSGVDSIYSICLKNQSKNPYQIFKQIVSLPFCHTHGPEHHVIVGVSLLTAYKNAGGEIDFNKALEEMLARGKKVPGGACGFWGACGAGISAGMFISIITGANPLKVEEWGQSNLMTATALKSIGEVGGPRCCKRNSYLAILSAVEFVKQRFGVVMEKQEITCDTYENNNQCIGVRCPFFKG